MHLNYCNGHGRCNGNTCDCFEGYGAATDNTKYRAPDCSARTCPAGISWGGQFKDANLEHVLEECSGRGNCDRSTGVCSCNAGYSGTACQRYKCPNKCSGNGRCLSMAKMAFSLDAYPLSLNLTQYDTTNVSNACAFTSLVYFAASVICSLGL